MIGAQAKPQLKRWGIAETVFIVWTGLALLVLYPAARLLKGSFPIFTVVWLVVPLLVVARAGGAGRVGFRSITPRVFLSTAVVNLGALILISLLVEPWSHAYQALVKGALASIPPDTTFAWLVRFKGLSAWGGLLLFSGLVTIFGEELFFRGWLLQALLAKMNKGWAILIQAVLFTIPQLLAALLLAPWQGVVYAVIYSFLGVGMIGGWAAARTRSIWPSLASAVIWNAILAAWVLS
ncbi:MAG: lysostaphin resistance A-like protein [Omnitrophica WOR_2 bacterium]